MERFRVIARNTARNNVLDETVSEVDLQINSAVDFNNKSDCIIDSINIGEKVKTLMSLLINTNSNSISKIKITNFLCNKISDIYRLPFTNREIIIRQLYNIIYNDNTLPTPIRLFYLRFKNEQISYSVSCKLYENGIREILQTIPYFQILKYILKSYLIDENMKVLILEEFDNLFTNETTSVYTKMEIADIFLLNSRLERGNEMLHILRTMGPVEEPIQQVYLNKTVYDDTQNVHSTNINISVLKASLHLIDTEHKLDFDQNEVFDALLKISPLNRISIETVLERIEIDTSRFSIDDNSFSLYILFSSLWSYIKKHSSSEELKMRLIEEIVSMEKYCSTGHVSRFINVIQGYTEDENLQIRISNKEQIISVVTTYLNNVLADAQEEVMNSMIEENQTPFLEFIKDKMNEKIPSIIEEYGDVHEYIISVVKSYSRWEFWNLMNNVLSVNL